MSKQNLQIQQFDRKRVEEAFSYIQVYWKRLERFHPYDEGTLVGLPRPYVVPSAGDGSSFEFEELYYWDSYFMSQAFFGTEKQQLAFDMTEDLLHLMRRFHVIPNGGRTYLTSRSQPPFLSTMVLQVYKATGDRKWLADAMSVAKDEYRKVWMGTTHPNWRQVFDGLSRYYDANMLHELAEAESGWDMTSRFNRKCLDYIPVDLNALLYKYETDFEYAALINYEAEEAAEWHARAKTRLKAMNEFLWNDEKHCYFDYNYKTREQGQVWSLAAFYPMWAGMVSRKQAKLLVAQLEKFEFSGGLTTTAAYPRVHHEIAEQWSYPNGWAPLQMIVIEALERYGYHKQAERIARKWLSVNLNTFSRQGIFLEKYNVVHPELPATEGVYPSQTGFGWTNALFVCLDERYLSAEELPEPVPITPKQPAGSKLFGARLRFRPQL